MDSRLERRRSVDPGTIRKDDYVRARVFTISTTRSCGLNLDHAAAGYTPECPRELGFTIGSREVDLNCGHKLLIPARGLKRVNASINERMYYETIVVAAATLPGPGILRRPGDPVSSSRLEQSGGHGSRDRLLVTDY